MVTVYLQGGLGNQLFQIAATYNHAKKNKDKAVFNLNNSHTPLQGENISKYKEKLFKELEHNNDVYNICKKTFQQKKHGYCEIPYEKDQQLQGYFQSEKFFIENKEEIKNLFRNGLIKNYSDKWSEINHDLSQIRNKHNKPIVSIHIRRGDYLRFPGIHDVCPINYYNKAMEIMKKEIGDFYPYFVSDDIKWCHKVFGDHGIFSNYNDEIEDLILMINSDHNVIANSSFSWWGAYLNNNDDKIVIGPKKWFGSRGAQDQEDTIPKNWIKI